MSNIITLTVNDLQTFLQNQKIFKGTLLEDINFNDEHIGSYFGETRNWDIISSDTFSFNKEKQMITLDKEHSYPFKQAQAFSDWVYRSYENEEYPWETNAWESGLVKISSDDDVDYNSSYIDIIIDALELYLIYIKSIS